MTCLVPNMSIMQRHRLATLMLKSCISGCDITELVEYINSCFSLLFVTSKLKQPTTETISLDDMYNLTSLTLMLIYRVDGTFRVCVDSLDCIEDAGKLLQDFIDEPELESKYSRINSGLLIFQIGYLLCYNPLVRFMNIAKRLGWNVVALKDYIPMTLTDYVSERLMNIFNVEGQLKFVAKCYEKSWKSNDCVVIYGATDLGPESPYMMIPLDISDMGSPKRIQDVVQNRNVFDIAQNIFRVGLMEYVNISFMSEMFYMFGTEYSLNLDKTYRDLHTEICNTKDTSMFVSSANPSYVNTALVYFLAESMLQHSVGGLANRKLFAEVGYYYALSELEFLVTNEYIHDNMMSMCEKFIYSSMKSLSRLAFSYLYSGDEAFIENMDHFSGDYLRYVSRIDKELYDIEDLDSICKLILSFNYRSIKDVTDIDVLVLLPICKYFYTCKWNLIKLLKHELEYTTYECTGVREDESFIFTLICEDLQMELYFKPELEKLNHKYSVDWKLIGDIDESSKYNMDKLSTIKNALSIGVLNPDEGVMTYNVSHGREYVYTYPDAKPIQISGLDSEFNFIAEIDNTLPYTYKSEKDLLYTSWGSTYRYGEIGDIPFYILDEDLSGINTLNRGNAGANLASTKLF